MPISITPQLEEFVKEQVTAGKYASRSEVVREGLRVLQDQESERVERQISLKKWIQDGLDDPRIESAQAVQERMRNAIAAAGTPTTEVTIVAAE